VRGVLFVVLLIVVFVGTFAAKQAVYNYSRRKQENGTAGPMTRRLFGQPGQDAWLHMNRAGFVVMAVFLTAALVLFDQWGGGIYSGTTHAVILVAGMAFIIGIRLVRWDKTRQNQ
jgi:hypothetical protein